MAINSFDVKVIEGKLGLNVPDWYMEFLSECRLVGMLSYGDVIDDVNEIIRCNMDVREFGAWGFRWNDSYLAIGGDGAGGLRFIDTKGTERLIYEFDHECPPENITDIKNITIWSYTAFISRRKADRDAAYKRAIKARNDIANRKWFEFWVPRQVPPVMKAMLEHMESAQQVDSAEASTIAVPPSEPSGSPR